MGTTSSATLQVPLVARSVSSRHSVFIVGPFYDTFFFIGAPLLALALAFLFFRIESPLFHPSWFAQSTPIAALLFARIFTQAHIFLVFGRSHLNKNIYREFPLRFTLIPLALLAGTFLSDAFLIGTVIIGGLWDIYHSSLQTFGFARIYDSKVGNDARMGRNLDIYLNHFLYIGAIVAGINFLPSLNNIFSYKSHPLSLGVPLLAFMQNHLSTIQRFTTLAALLFLVFYLFSYIQFIQKGYQVSIQKILLLLSTAFVSLYAWGYFPLPIALFVVNFFHAWQYFAVLWWSDNKNLSTYIPTLHSKISRTLLLLSFLFIPLLYGALVILHKGSRTLFCFASVFSILHYWYDGFIWSVRKKLV